MDAPEKKTVSAMLRITTLALLALICAGLGFYEPLSMLGSHMAYVVIVLAGIWFGRNALYVAALLALATLVTHLASPHTHMLASDLVRAGFMIGVAFCIGTLGQRSAAMEKAMTSPTEREIVEAPAAGLMIYRNDAILLVSKRFADMLAYDAAEMEGQEPWSFCHPDERERVHGFAALREEGAATDLHYECRLVRKDGAIIWADLASSAVNYNGEPAVCVSAHDITEQKQAEAERRELTELAREQEEQLVHSTRLAELGEMAASIAHELNQPLTGIRTFAKNAHYMLEHEAGSRHDVMENLDMVAQQVDRASRIIGQMRQLTRRTERQWDEVDLNVIVSETVEFVQPQLRLDSIELSVALADSLPKVTGDRIRLEQVFLNLLANAKQAMQESEHRRLSVTTRFDTAHDLPVVAEIRDTGKGFAPEDAAKIFMPFYSTKEVGRGTGLGLSISLGIIKDHQGVIEAIGRPGKGATFRVRLPLRHDAARWEKREVHE